MWFNFLRRFWWLHSLIYPPHLPFFSIILVSQWWTRQLLDKQEQLPEYECEDDCQDPVNPGKPWITPAGTPFYRKLGSSLSIIVNAWLGRAGQAASTSYRLFHERQLVFEKSSEEAGSYQQGWEDLVNVTESNRQNYIHLALSVPNIQPNLAGRWSFSHGESREPAWWDITIVRDAEWSEWGSWGNCSKACLAPNQTEPGQRVRSRECLAGDIQGLQCRDLDDGSEEVKPCAGPGVNMELCPSQPSWTSWTEWTECSPWCGGDDLLGRQSRARYCSPGIHTECPQEDEIEERDCKSPKCPPDMAQ